MQLEHGASRTGFVDLVDDGGVAAALAPVGRVDRPQVVFVGLAQGHLVRSPTGDDLTGAVPMAPRNQSAVRPLVERMKTRSPSRTIQIIRGRRRTPLRRRVTTWTRATAPSKANLSISCSKRWAARSWLVQERSICARRRQGPTPRDIDGHACT
jgi:hypothetical protein